MGWTSISLNIGEDEGQFSQLFLPEVLAPSLGAAQRNENTFVILTVWNPPVLQPSYYLFRSQTDGVEPRVENIIGIRADISRPITWVIRSLNYGPLNHRTNRAKSHEAKQPPHPTPHAITSGVSVRISLDYQEAPVSSRSSQGWCRYRCTEFCVREKLFRASCL